MSEEEKKEDGTSSSASEETKAEDQNQTQEQGQKVETQEQETGTADQLAELQKQVKEAEEKTEKLSKQNEQAGYVIQKLKDRMKEEGIEPEEGQGLSEDKVQELVQKSTAPLLEEIKGLKTTLSEQARANKAQPSKGGGGPGQKPPEKEKAPDPETDQAALRAIGLIWDPDKKAYVKKDENGKIIRIYDPKKQAKTVLSPDWTQGNQ